jgi:RHS repeat-associated protein
MKQPITITRLFTLLLLMLSGLTAHAAEQVFYYHLDAQGSPVVATNQAGEVVWRETYRAYGTRQLNQDGGQNRIGFTGKPQDTGTGLSYYGARWYDANLGRFISPDPAGFVETNPVSFNRYAYANNNPVRYVDPDGRWAEDAVLGVPSLALGINSFVDNIKAGNYLSATVDAGGIIADGAAILAPGIPGGAGLGIKIIREGGERAVTKKPVVIGENMKDRVIPAAKNRGADYYKPRKTKGDPLKKNERWIDDKMREGREIIDIGPDPRRSKRSPFYEAEKRSIEKRNYPVTK